MKRILNHVKSLVSALDGDETASSSGPEYDPVHVAAILVGSLFSLGALYWLLWSLLVCGGGIFAKIGPIVQILLTGKTARDFGYGGYPYRLGVFEGWIVNVTALLIGVVLLASVWWVFKTVHPDHKKEWEHPS